MKRDDDIEEWLEIMLEPKDGEYDPADTLPKQTANAIRLKILAEPDEDERELMHEDLRTAIANVIYGGRDPKSVPKHVMLHCQHYPINRVFTHIDARKRIKNANTGIRTMCLECQGNDTVGVRQCPSLNCPLWPFRMGGNPFYGRLVNSTGEEESNETEAEIEAMEAERTHGYQG